MKVNAIYELIVYVLHKALKKMRLSGVRGSNVHKTAKIEPGTSFLFSSIGKYSFCGYDCDINRTKIGSFCSIANNVVIGGNAHPVSWASTSPVFYNNRDSIKKKFSRHERVPPMTTMIGHDVWIGQDVLIKQGVVVGVGAVIGMGAIVTKDVEPYSIVVGNPAQKIKMRFDIDIVSALLASCWWECTDEQLEQVAFSVCDPQAFILEIARVKGLKDG